MTTLRDRRMSGHQDRSNGLSLPQFGTALAAAVMLIFGAFFMTIDHDESQYIAAVALMRDGLPFRDFLYLQTPLQPLLLAPLAWLTNTYLFITLRLTNAVAGAGVLLVVYHAVARHGGTVRHALGAVVLTASTGVFISSSSLARNDALPMLLYALGIYVALKQLNAPTVQGGSGGRRFLLAGLLMGAAASTKISYGIPAAVAGVWAVTSWRVLGSRNVIAFAIGGLTGLLPIAIFWLIAPDATMFGIFEYSLKAPHQFRALNGQAEMTGWYHTVYRFFRFLCEGPSFFALLLIAGLRVFDRQRSIGKGLAASFGLLDALILAGLLVTILPQPTYRQYLGPVVAQLYIRLGLSFGLLAPYRRLAVPLLAFGALIGLLSVQRVAIGNALRGQSPPMLATMDAHWIGSVMRRHGAEGPLAGLRPERFADSAWPLDPRFAAGPFIFRTLDLLSRREERTMSVVAHRNLASAFREVPPAGIVVGSEHRRGRFMPGGLDHPLTLWAAGHGYRPIVSPSGTVTLYLRPRSVPLAVRP